MTLVDAGPLIALIDSKDKKHSACVSVLPGLRTPLITTWPCFTEAMYLLGEHGGHRDQERLWALIDSGTLTIHATLEAERHRMRVLMQNYKDTPMDLADASLVAAAETLGLSCVFTTDSHFYAYQIDESKHFEVMP